MTRRKRLTKIEYAICDLNWIINFCKNNNCLSATQFMKISPIGCIKLKQVLRKNSINNWGQFRKLYLDGRHVNNNSKMLKAKFASGKLVAWNKGLTRETSQGVRNNAEAVSKAKKGKHLSETNKRGISKSLTGHDVTEETKQKQRIAARRRVQNNLENNIPNYCPNIGKHEKELLDKQEIIDNIPIYRQYYIYKLGLTIDGYNPFINTAYEVYEKRHLKNVEKDLKRQKEIEDCLNCKFVIILDETH